MRSKYKYNENKFHNSFKRTNGNCIEDRWALGKSFMRI